MNSGVLVNDLASWPISIGNTGSRYGTSIMSNNMRRLLLAAALLGLIAGVQASEFDEDIQQFKEDAKQVMREIKMAIDAIDLYRVPPAPRAAEEELVLTCRELEWAMTAAVSKSYSYNPSFYDDPVQGAGMWVGTMGGLYYNAYVTVLYGIYTDYKEDRRVISAEDRIAVLRHLKAEKRCYES